MFGDTELPLALIMEEEEENQQKDTTSKMF